MAEYRVVYNKDVRKLAEECDALAKDGFIPTGGLIIGAYGEAFQAMFKADTKKAPTKRKEPSRSVGVSG